MTEKTLRDWARAKKVKLVDISRQMDVNKSSVTRWFQDRPPAERTLELSKVTGIPKYILRPDIFTPPKRRSK